MTLRPSPQRRADSPRLLREINDQVVLALLLAEGPMTRGRVGEQTGLSKPTVSALLARLDERGLVTTTGVVTGGPGPNARIYAVNPRAAYVIGVHVEQRMSVACLSTLTGEVIARHGVEVRHRLASAPIGEMTAAVDGVLSAAGLPRSAVHRVVVATPGVIDPVTGQLRHARHIKGWETPGLTELMADTLDIPVSHGNDVNLAAVAEGLLGAARNQTDYALLWLDRGVGLGIVMDGAIRTGAHGSAGEIGYLPVTGQHQPRVDRGAAGGFQQLVGGRGIRALAKKHGIRATEPAAIVTAALAMASNEHVRKRDAANGDAAIGEAFLSELADGIALGATAVTTLLDPALLVLGGPVALVGGQPLLDKVVASMRRSSFVRSAVVLSTVHDNGVLYGAIEIGLQAVRTQLFGQSAATLSRGAVG